VSRRRSGEARYSIERAGESSGYPGRISSNGLRWRYTPGVPGTSRRPAGLPGIWDSDRGQRRVKWGLRALVLSQ
jgi:hypothetical protein